MTDANTIFNGEDQTPVVQSSMTSDEALFNALVGETQKYKTPDDLAKAYANADQFIETLKEENRKLREQVTQARTIDDVLERITTQGNAPVDDIQHDSGLTPDAVQQLVEKTLQGREVQKTKTDNLLLADRLMKDMFGEKAAEVFKQRANTPEKQRVLMELAATDPQDFVNIFGITSNTQSNTMDTGSVNTTSVPSSGRNRDNMEGTKEWATKVRKENPSLYWSQDFQYKLQQTVTKNPDLYFGQ